MHELVVDWGALLAPGERVDVSAGVVVAVVVAALVLSVPRVTWRWFGLFTTLVHELGHAVAAVVTGRFVSGIRIRGDHSGDTRSMGRPGFSTVLSGVMGYPAPAIVGAALVCSVLTGWQATALFVGGVVLVVTLVVVRNVFGVVVVLASIAVSAALWVWGTPTVQAYALVIVGVALLIGAVRGWVTVAAVHVRHRERLASSDAYLLARSTGVPSVVWLALFAVLIVGSYVAVGWVYVSRG